MKRKNTPKENELVSIEDEWKLYDLFGITPEVLIEKISNFLEGKSITDVDCEYLKKIQNNPFLFFDLPKSAIYLQITNKNPWFYNSALKAFERGVRDKQFKEFLKEKNLNSTMLIVKSRRDYLQAREEVDEFLKGKTKKSKQKEFGQI